MGKRKNPRHGSMQFWPRVRAKRQYARIRSWAQIDKPSFLAFPCYKAGMTHVIGIDTRKTSHTKGDEVSYPTTVLECPPIHILSLRFYKTNRASTQVAHELLFKPAKEVARKRPLPKKFADIKDIDTIKADDYSDVVAVVATQPKLIKLKKKPEIFEIKIGGKTIQEKLDFLKNHIGKEITISTVFEEGSYVDVHGVTTGKGNQGPVKRFGIGIRHHKSEKTKRGPGSLGGWTSQGHVMYRIAHSGQMGYHQRVEYNKQIFKIGKDDITPKGDFLHYGPVRMDYVMLAGSVLGPTKRTLFLTQPIRLKTEKPLPIIQYISRESKQ